MVKPESGSSARFMYFMYFYIRIPSVVIGRQRETAVFTADDVEFFLVPVMKTTKSEAR